MKIFRNITLAAGILCAFASCDKDADKVAVVNGQVVYDGYFDFSLYVPEYAMEINNSNALCSDSVPGTFLFDASSDGLLYSHPEFKETVDLRLPFLQSDGEVLEIYRGGMLAKLYYRLKAAADKGLLPMAEFDEVRNELDTIVDHLTIKELKTSKIPWVYAGSTIVTYDNEQNSYYARFTLEDAEYVRESNIFTVLQKLRPHFEQWSDEKTLTDEDVKDLKNLQQQREKSIYNGGGWCTMSNTNYSMSADIHIEQATGLLDDLSISLFGRDKNGKPAKELWIVLRYFGGLDQIKNYSAL